MNFIYWKGLWDKINDLQNLLLNLLEIKFTIGHNFKEQPFVDNFIEN